jgi:hypothetical protein
LFITFSKIITVKKIILPLTLLLFIVQSFSQAPAHTKDYYLQKSKNQKTTGWVLLAGGTTMAVIGAIIFSQSDFLSSDDPGTDAGGFLFVGGIVADLASIPFFIGSAKNARKAATISFNNQKIVFPQHNGFAARTLPSITLRIGL